MLDSLSLNPFKFSDAGKKKGSPFGFHMLKKGSNLFDGVTGTPAVCSIFGARYGIVNGVVTQFAANVPPVEDKGLRGCPAFTQLAKYTEDLTNAVWSKNKVLNPVLITTFQGQSFWKITEMTESGNHSVAQTGPWVSVPDNAVIGLSFVCKSDGRALEIVLRSKDGSSYPVVCRVGTNGIISSKNASAFAVSESIGGGLYRITAAIPCGAGASNPYIYWQMWNGTTSNYTGDGVSGVYLGQPTYINFGVGGIPFNPPYVPNNTGSSVSVVSEAATATTGTSFDLDLPALSAFKDGLRGKAIGANLWGTPTFSTPPWTDNSTHYVCNGTNNYSTFSCAGVLTTGKLYELTFTTGSITSGALRIYIGSVLVFDGTPTANTTYIMRTATPTTGSNATFTNSNAFIGQIRKDIVIKEVQAQGHIELEVESNVDSGWLANSSGFNVVSINNQQYTNGALFFYKNSSGGLTFNLRDSLPNDAIISNMPTFTVGQTFRIAIDYGTYTDGAQKMRLTVNGIKSSVVAFSGSFGTQGLKFFYGSLLHAFFIKLGSFKFIPKPIW